MSSEHSELRVLRGIHHHHASLHELVSLHSHMLIAQIEKLRTDVATLETDLTESRLQQQKQLSVLRDQQEVLESQNSEIESARSAKITHATEMESVRNSLQREIQTLIEKVTVTEVALEAEAAAKRAAEAALISMRADNEKKILDVKAQLGEHHKELLTQQRILLSETFAKEAELKQAAAIALEREKFAEKMAETKSLLRSVVETLKKENEELTIQLEDAEKENDDLLSRLERAESVVRSAQQVNLAASLAAEARERAEREGRERIERLEMEAREKVEKETREKAQRDEQKRIEKERIAKEEEEIEQQKRAAAEEEAALVALVEAERLKNEKNEQDALRKETSTKSSSSTSSASASSPSPVRAFGAKLGGSTSTSTSPFGASLNGAKKSTPSFLSSVAAARLHEQTTKTAESIPSSSSIASTEVPPLTSSSSSSTTAATEVIPIEERARREAERLRNRSVFGGGIKKDAANDPPAAAPPSVPKWKIGATPTPVAAPVTAPIAPVAILSNNSQPIQVLSVPSSTPTSAPAPVASKALDMLAGVSAVDSAAQSTETASVFVSTETIEIEDSYTSMNKEELKALLSDRGLVTSGKMKELRSRLREDDLAKDITVIEKEERKAKKKQEKAAAAAVKVVTTAEEGSSVPAVPIRKPPPAPPG
jgi:hypothetical protein